MRIVFQMLIAGTILISFFTASGFGASLNVTSSPCPTLTCSRPLITGPFSLRPLRRFTARASLRFPPYVYVMHPFSAFAGPLPTCKCDPLCSAFGDCCVDAPSVANSSLANVAVTCASIPTNSSGMLNVYLRSSCLSGSFRTKCQQSSNYSTQVKDSLLKFRAPVTSLETNVTYGNLFCARCDNVVKYEIWPMNVQCASVSENLTIVSNSSTSSRRSFIASRPELKGKLRFNETLGLWQMDVGNHTENCTLRPIPPDRARVSLRACTPDVVSNCSANATVSGEAAHCPAHLSVVWDANGVAYRNVDCAMCNGVSSTGVQCYPSLQSKKRMSTRLSLSKVTQSTSATTGTSKTTVPTTSSSVTNTRSRTTSRTTTSTSRTSSTATATPTTRNRRRAYMYLQVKMDCLAALKLMNFTKISAETVYSLSMNRSYIRNRTLVAGETIEVCQVNDVTERAYDTLELDEASRFDQVLFLLGELVVILVLVLHLVAFSPPTASRSSNAKAFASFVFGLLLGNVGLSMIRLNETGFFCPIISVSLYYGFMSSYLWLSSMAFDLSCVVWTVAYECQKPNDAARRFRVYSILCWGAPVVFMALMYYFEKDEPVTFFQDCVSWSEYMLLLFFILPLTVSMSVSMAFYLCSAYVVYTEPMVGVKLSSVHSIDFKQHTSLVMTTNLMTLSLMVETSYSWLVFIVLNGVLAFLVYRQSPIENLVSWRASQLLKQHSSDDVDK